MRGRFQRLQFVSCVSSDSQRVCYLEFFLPIAGPWTSSVVHTLSHHGLVYQSSLSLALHSLSGIEEPPYCIFSIIVQPYILRSLGHNILYIPTQVPVIDKLSCLYILDGACLVRSDSVGYVVREWRIGDDGQGAWRETLLHEIGDHSTLFRKG